MRENCDSVVVAMDGGEFAKVMDAETISQMAQGECAYEGSFNEMVADALVAAFDEEETPEDFWEEHDRRHHHGHYDPTTQRCSLREKAKAEEERREGEDRETDDLGGESPDGGREGPLVSEEEDAAYLDAVRRGDMETAARMVRDAAKKAFPDTKVIDTDRKPMVVWHATDWNPYAEPNGEAVFSEEKIGTSHDKGYYGHGFYFGRSKGGVRQYLTYKDGIISGNIFPFFLNIKNPCIKPEGGFDSDTPIENDGIIVGGDRYYEKPYYDPINWGEFIAYSSNQIKSADPVTYDDEGEVVPLSKRFDSGNDIRGDVNWREKGSRATSAKPEPLKPREMGISRIFTGSAADYGKPSLLKVGTGEGSQVYGWGLYGSDQKGVAESYAAVGTDRKGYTGYSKGGRLIRTNEGSGDIESDAATMLALYGDLETAKKEALGFPNGAAIARELEEHGAEYREEWPHAVVYEQTFFTDREPGDESHLLKWYEPSGNIKEQLGWIREQAKLEGFLDKPDKYGNTLSQFLNTAEKTLIGRNGQDIYSAIEGRLGSPKAASEFFARAGIDGIKYPVDSYGGKGVKNGDEAGWNYVSFRDDNIRIDRKYVDGQKVYDYQKLMSKRFPGVDALSVLNRISKMGSPEAMAAEFRRILGSGKMTEDSMNEVMALAVEAAFGLDEREKREEGKKALGYVDGLVEMTALHNPPKDKTRPYALNCLEGKWEFFDTEEERDEWLKWHDAECSKTTMEEARAWIAQELPRIKAHIRGKDKNAAGEVGFNEEAAEAIEAAFGIGQDALDPRDPDFWMKHDRAKHGGHFDPDTMSCELREEMGLPTVKNRGERDAAKAREDAKIDDLGEETPQDGVGAGVDAKKAALADAIGKTAPKMNAGQMVDAVEWMARKPTAKQDVANSAKTLKNKARQTSKVSAQDFHKAISEAKEARSAADRWRVDVHPVEDYEQDECYMSEGGSTFAIADGDIISVCKNPMDTQCSGVDLMREAVEAGGKKLDSYEGNHRFYVKCGFKPVAWTKFNPDYAEPGTPPEDVIFYIYTGEARKMSPEDAVADIERFKGETQAMEYMDAGSYRDSLLA